MQQVITLSQSAGEIKTRDTATGSPPFATISAHNDPVLGELVADAMEKVGGEGVISLEESKTTETQIEVVEGLQSVRMDCLGGLAAEAFDASEEPGRGGRRGEEDRGG